MSDPRKRLSWAWSGLLVCVLAACTTITENVPSSPSDSVTVVVVPLASPVTQPTTPVASPPSAPATQPTPTPSTPTPQPSATPAPEPGATPMPATACTLPAGNPNAPCDRAAPEYLGDVTAAIDQVIKENPGWFAPQSCGSCYIALDPTRYVNGVMRALQQRGYCVFNDGEELGVKKTNAFNEQYDILSSENWVRRAYASTCAPAWF